MDLQALRYAAMISVMTFDELVSTDAPTSRSCATKIRFVLGCGDWRVGLVLASLSLRTLRLGGCQAPPVVCRFARCAKGRSDPHRATNHDKIRSLGGGLLRSLRV
jgi:hypothetical protein